MFKQIAYPYLVSVAGSPAPLTLTAPSHQPASTASPTRSRDFPWLWLVLLTGLGLLVWWLIRQGPTGRAILWADLTGRTPTPVVSSQSVPDQPAPVATAIQQARVLTEATLQAVIGEPVITTTTSPVGTQAPVDAIALADRS
jgi:hypothetical protein